MARLEAGQHQVGKDAQGRGDKGQAQVGHAPPRGPGQAALPGAADIGRAPDDGDDEIEGKDPEERAGDQVGGMGLKDAIVPPGDR